MYAPTTLAPPRDFYTLRYTTILENRNMVVGDQHYSLFCCEVQSILSDRWGTSDWNWVPQKVPSLVCNFMTRNSVECLSQICERSLSGAHEGPMLPPVQSFVRAEILPSGYLIRPCEGGGCIIHIVDHMDLQACFNHLYLRTLNPKSITHNTKLFLCAILWLPSPWTSDTATNSVLIPPDISLNWARLKTSSKIEYMLPVAGYT